MPGRQPRRYPHTPVPLGSRIVPVLLGALAWGAVACGPDLFLAATSLEITPNPAQPGDLVKFTFHLALVPEQSFTVVALVDGVEHSSKTEVAAVDGPYDVELGDAGDLIATYGAGAHVASIEVRLNDRGRVARTADKVFELQESAPPPGSRAP